MNLVDKISNASGYIAKEHLLRDISYEWWQTFIYAYSIDSVYKLKFHNPSLGSTGEPTKEMFNILNDILDGRLHGDEARNAVEAFAQVNGNLIKRICNKDLRCGVTATTFNKVYPGAIPQFNVQLAKEAPIETLEYPMLAQLKYDGVRLIAIVSDTKVTFKTRNGKKVKLPKLAAAISKINAVNFMLDGEITYTSGKMEDRTGISGAINSAMHGGAVDESNMVFNVFDTMSKLQLECSKCNLPYSERYTTAMKLVGAADSEMVVLATTNEVHSPEGVNTLYSAAIEQGYEGLILKPHEHLYTFKRSKDWVKLKEIKTADLTCVGIEEGSGKYEGMIGALMCKGEVEGKDVIVNVGSGLTDLDRSLLARDYYGQLIEIKYNSLIQDSVSRSWSLFLPRFVRVRTDK